MVSEWCGGQGYRVNVSDSLQAAEHWNRLYGGKHDPVLFKKLLEAAYPRKQLDPERLRNDIIMELRSTGSSKN